MIICDRVTVTKQEQVTTLWQDTNVIISIIVNDLGILLDTQLTVANHIAALSRSCFFQLCQKASVHDTSSGQFTLAVGLATDHLEDSSHHV